jgi:phosphoglycolate phosphatase-like HAD superfamily hydrolase
MIKNIIFDFDGVILDSVPIKTEAYRVLFKDYEDILVEELIKYHEINGGISRYEKIKYFFNKLLNQEISKKSILKLANDYSSLTKEELSKSKYLIEDTISFIKRNYQNYNLHIASGADEGDLKDICNSLDISKYFLSINGSPIIKSVIIKEIINTHKYCYKETILIGDSINDYNAAKLNNISFYAYNNSRLMSTYPYLNSFYDFK